MCGALLEVIVRDAVGLEVHDHELAALLKEAVHNALQEYRVIRVHVRKLPHGAQQREAILAQNAFAPSDARRKRTLQKAPDRTHIHGPRLLVRQLALRAHRLDLRAHARLVLCAGKVEVLHR